MGDPQAAARERMVQTQLVPRGISDPKVLYAMRKVPRHLFVEEALQNQAYGDFPLAPCRDRQEGYNGVRGINAKTQRQQDDAEPERKPLR